MYKIAGNEHPICDNCRCDDIRLIEINHKNGDGARDTKSSTIKSFYTISSRVDARPMT